ncbi:MAG: sugar phosphate isomerase/epimerase [Gemmatimonadota bacterium]|nr:sugar phosphate isomerase/epimerase [Gemmatimonadota bacterium]
MERREFFRTTFGALAGSALLPQLARAGWRDAGTLGPIGIQLYTVRREMAKDVDAALATIAQIGYREVEFAGLFGHSAKDVRAMLDRHGLRAPSSHVALPDDMTRWPAALDDANTLGQAYIICPSFDDRYLTPDGIRQIAARFNVAGEAARKAGLQFGFHNHDAIFKAAGGKVLYDLLLAQCDPKLVVFEIDVYWMVTGGADPLAYLAKYPGRFPLIHAKDRARDGKMTDVGSGTLDWPRLLRAFERQGLKHTFVENDEAADPYASARASYAYLSRLTF